MLSMQFRYLHLTLIVALIARTPLHATIFSSAWNDIKKAANKTADAFETAGKAIGDRFKSTKLTRAADYAARKAAFELSLRVASGILNDFQTLSAQTLVAAEKSAELGFKAADGFLSSVVKNASPALLENSAAAAQAVLEGAKKSGVGVLQGTEWVANKTVGNFDLNRIRYEGDLQGLTGGVLGKVLCEGKLFGKEFSMNIKLDPRDIPKSVKPLIDEVGKELEKTIIDPMKRGLDTVSQAIPHLDQVAHSLSEQRRPAEIDTGIAAAEKAQNALATINAQEKAAIASLVPEMKKLDETAAMSKEQLLAVIQQQGASAGYSGVAARQELARRQQEKR